MNEFLDHGSKWTLISEKIKGKNVFCVKNRFFHLIKKFNASKIHQLLKETLEIKNKYSGRLPTAAPIYPQINTSQTRENQQMNNFSPFYLQSFRFIFIKFHNDCFLDQNSLNYQLQPNFNAFLVVPIILSSNQYPETQQNINIFNDIHNNVNSLTKLNNSEVLSLNGEETDFIENKSEKESVDKFFSF